MQSFDTISSESGIYIHIPFCKQACTYCDFYFETSRKHRDAFVDKLVEEIRFWSTKEFGQDSIATIYFGGGTPSTLTDAELRRIMEALSSSFYIQSDAEITFEVNPDDINDEKLRSLKNLGVNRLSIGIQTFNQERLEFMNRAHTVHEAKHALHLIQHAGLKSWTADLIYGNPGQTVKDLLTDIDQLLSFNPPHISAYTLTVEPHTRLGSLVRKNLIQPADDEQVSEQMSILRKKLEEAGLHRYEVSNFSKPGHESRHNSAYWEHKNYLGLGPSAHSFRWDATRTHAQRWNNKASLKQYLIEPVDTSPTNLEKLDLKTLAEERLLLGLRTREGVKISDLQGLYKYSLNNAQLHRIERFKSEHYLTSVTDKLQLTETGINLSDYITLEIISSY